MKTPRLAEAFSFAPTRAQWTCRGAIYRVDVRLCNETISVVCIASTFVCVTKRLA
jgi:hypothetical protein